MFAIVTCFISSFIITPKHLQVQFYLLVKGLVVFYFMVIHLQTVAGEAFLKLFDLPQDSIVPVYLLSFSFEAKAQQKHCDQDKHKDDTPVRLIGGILGEFWS